MTVETDNASDGPYTANGSITVFPFTFTALEAGDVRVVFVDVNGLETVASSSDYDVSISTQSGGSVTFLVAPADGLSVYVELDPSFTQSTEFEEGPYLPSAHNAALDRAALRDQSLRFSLGRSAQFERGASVVRFAEIGEGQTPVRSGNKFIGAPNEAAEVTAAAQQAAQTAVSAAAASTTVQAAVSVDAGTVAADKAITQSASNAALAAKDIAVSASDIAADLGSATLYDAIADFPTATGALGWAIIPYGTDEGLYEDTGSWTRRSSTQAVRAKDYADDLADFVDSDTADRMAFAQADSNKKAVGHIDNTGIQRFAHLNTRRLNGFRPEASLLGQQPYAGRFLDCLIFLNNSGQSLGEQHVGGGNMTLTQEYGSRAFQFQDDDVAGLKPLVSDDSTLIRIPSLVNRYGENPMFGMCGFIWELLEKENGITPDMVGMALVTGNNAKGATGIANLDQGSTEYNSAIAQAAALAAAPPEVGSRVRTFGTGWYQGESDTDTLDYDDRLKQLALDYAADLRSAVPAQDFDPLLVAYQPTSDNAGGNRYAVNRLIFNACAETEQGQQYNGFDVPLTFSTPNYFMDFRHDTANGVHVKALDAKWLGAYTALVFKRRFIDGVSWPMMRPVSVTTEGGAIFIKYQMRSAATRLIVAEVDNDDYEWNGEALPRQTNRGFHCVDGGGNDIALAGLPEVVAPDTIRIIPSGSVGDVVRVDYGQRDPLYMHPFKGSAGNFRDNYGDLVRYDAVNRPMHNWMPVHSMLLAATTTGFTLD